MAAGLWPVATTTSGGGGGDECVDEAHEATAALTLVRACRGSVVAVQRAYELLLSRRAPWLSNEPLLTAPRMRTQLLASLRVLAREQLQVGVVNVETAGDRLYRRPFVNLTYSYHSARLLIAAVQTVAAHDGVLQ